MKANEKLRMEVAGLRDSIAQSAKSDLESDTDLYKVNVKLSMWCNKICQIALL